jgi:hypothetical protein
MVAMPTTDDPKVPHAQGGPDDEPVRQADVYLVMSEEERAKGYMRPLRFNYYHLICGTITTMHRDIAETFSCNPEFYHDTFCAYCSKHRPLSEFVWVSMDGNITDLEVGT